MKKAVTKYPIYLYILAVIVGVAIIFLPDMNPFPYVLGLIYFFSGLVFGIFWPLNSWRWGLWIAGPLLFLMLVSTAFAGISKIFIEDLLIIIVPIISACGGGLLGSLFKRPRLTQSP